MEWKSEVESIVFNKDYQASQFWPEIKDTATVFDSFTKKIRPSKGSEPARVTGQGGTVGTPSAEAATRPFEWLPWVSYGTAALGIAALAAAAVMRYRQA